MRLAFSLLALGLLALGGAAAPLMAPAEAGRPACDGPSRQGATVRGTPCADRIVLGKAARVAYGGGGADVIYATEPGQRVFGGGGDDRIFATALGGVEVEGGAGDDVLYGNLSGPPAKQPAATAAPPLTAAACTPDCGLGSQRFEGGPGDDTVFGERGNDAIFGDGGDDHLYGGIGDDTLRGGDGNDQLSGGFGADDIDGEVGDDYVRGDATIDHIADTGPATDTDALSFATGAPPGFPNDQSGASPPYPDFAAFGLPVYQSERRGVYVDLGLDRADQGVARFGGGVDDVEGGDFEEVIGTALPDFIVGSSAGETIYGGGGGDVILGGGGDDRLFGGADGDRLEGGGGELDGGAGDDYCSGATATNCERSGASAGVILRDASKVAVGELAPEDPRYADLYLTGSEGSDSVKATYEAGPPAAVAFQLDAGEFDQSSAADGGCAIQSATTAVCPLAKPLDALLIAGLGGDDAIRADGFPTSASLVLSGGAGDDDLTGGDQGEDVLADDSIAAADGADVLRGLGRDDALLNNGGADRLEGGDGNDLFISASVCDGDALDGGAARDNGSWFRVKDSPVEVRLDQGAAGRPGGGAPECGGGSLDDLAGIEDVEGTAFGDVLVGDGGDNQLLGWAGSDAYLAQDGVDRILANSGDTDATIDCGPGAPDAAVIDRRPAYGDSPVNCETVTEADPNRFGADTSPPAPPPPPALTATVPPSPANDNAPLVLGIAEPGSTVTLYGDGACAGPPLGSGSAESLASPGIAASVPDDSTTSFHATATDANGAVSACSTQALAYVEDSTGPQTRIVHRPRKLVRTRKRTRVVAFRFRASERGASFRCRLGNRHWSKCRAPKRYRVRLGRHVVAIAAYDAIGNRDPTPARFRFRVKRVRG